MKLTAEDFRRHYASLPDEGLLSLERDELVDIARECYDAELLRRGLTRAPTAARESEIVEEPQPGEAGEPAVVATFAYSDAAKLAREVLKSAKIPCYLENEHLASDSFWSHATGGMRLMVPAQHLESARELLADATAVKDTTTPAEPWDGSMEHRFVGANSIRVHYVEAGSGPLVVLLHGFPESWYSWRHQLRALAEEGYHAVAPDLRGYGQTDRPEPLEAYDILQLTADVVGLVNELGQAPAVVVGHDWGAWLAAHAALLRPDLFRAVALLSVPYVPRRAVNESEWEQQKYPGKIFYQATLRSSMAEQFFGTNVRERLLAGLWALSGDVKPENRWKPVRDPDAPRSLRI